ncbi:MAG: dTDP-4-dehydrorhamnose reductase [Acidimicrobiaceae bacterium]|jgi:dTDP-4-dehydrorhamnose reductase
MNLLVTGAGGQVGRELAEFSRSAGDGVTAADHAMLDVTDRDAVRELFLSARPEVVVHAASWTAVDACESDPERAGLVNGAATANVAEASRAIGAHLIHLSTDYVFDGTKSIPYVETDAPNPVSVYGKSKLEGERALDVSSHTIVRISWVCGRYGNNMVKTLMRLAADGVDPKFVDDQIGHPTIVSDLVPMLHRLASERRPGLFHVTNQGVVSWYEFARATFAAAGHDPERVSPISTSELDPPRPAPRPANSVLDNAALRAAAMPLLPDFRESLSRLVRDLAP